jgi:large subunit ribosomal protein L5
MARLQEYYKKEVMGRMMKEFKYKNVMQVPKVTKVVLNIGMGEATQNVKVLDSARKNSRRSPVRRP